MVSTFLEKLQSDYLEEKVQMEQELNSLQIHLKENVEFITLLEEAHDPNFEAFSPRKIHSKNKNKIQELKEEQKELELHLKKKKKEYHNCQKKIEELSAVMKDIKDKMKEKSTVPMDDEVYRLTLLETQENERQRISRELHDSTVQNLTSLVHKSELCGKLVDMDPIRCKLELNTMSKTLREIINDTRQMIYDLRPMSFDDIGLDVTIERALEKLENSELKKIDFFVLGEPYSIKPVIGITLLRIIQEACSNAIKHAHASLIKVVLEYGKNKVSVRIEDDGDGFDSSHIDTFSQNDNSGFGLSMMKERAYLLSGNINIVSKIKCGTQISVEVPIVE